MPPTPIIGELKIDPDYFTESLHYTLKGTQGVRNYRVNTINTALALFADGIPHFGELWGETKLDSLNLKVTEFETFLIGGQDSGDGSGGWTRVQVLYATPTATPIRIPADIRAQWTDLTPSRGQFQQIKSLGRVGLSSSGGINGSEYPATTAIANGEGCPVDFGSVEARVYTFHELNSGFDLPMLTALMRPSKINDADLKLPPLYGDRTSIALAKGKARYVSFEPSVVGQYRQVVHVLEIAEDFYFRWAPKDRSGNPAGDAFADRVHYFDDFNGLWRQ